MKIVIFLLVLIIITSVLSYKIHNKREEIIGLSNYSDCVDRKGTSEECQEIFEKAMALMSECSKAMNKVCNMNKNFKDKNSLDKVCINWNSDSCKNLVKNGVESIPECRKIKDDSINEFKSEIKNISIFLNFACAKDEENNNCPYVKLFLNENSTKPINVSTLPTNISSSIPQKRIFVEFTPKQESDTMNAINESCKSQKCTEALIDLYSNLPLKNYIRPQTAVSEVVDLDTFITQMEYQNRYNRYLEYLKSKQCTSKLVKNNEKIAETTNIKPSNNSNNNNSRIDVESNDATKNNSNLAVFALFVLVFTFL